MSSTSLGVTPRSKPWLARHLPSAMKAMKPTTYMRPYQRTAKGPKLKTMGSICGCVSIARIIPQEARSIGAAGTQGLGVDESHHEGERGDPGLQQQVALVQGHAHQLAGAHHEQARGREHRVDHAH